MIALISDSHVPHRSPEIPEKFIELVEEADMTVHCGDFEEKKVYQNIKDVSEKLIAVKGNCDRFELPNSETFNKNGVEFGVYHGTGITPRGDHSTLLKIAEEDLEVDVLLHGHTHNQEAAEKDGKILLNPGSCTGVGGGSSRPGNPKMMVLKVKDVFQVDILELEDESIVKKTRKFDIESSEN